MPTTLRPHDRDAVRTVLRSARRDTGVPVVFAGTYEGEQLILHDAIGVRTNGIRGLEVRHGTGLGGRVAATLRPATVRDYIRSDAITPHYRNVVHREGLRGMVAVPVVVDGAPRTVLYGAVRVKGGIDDDVTRGFRTLAGRLSEELRIRDEVDRRVAEIAVAHSECGTGLEPADRERLRLLQGERRAVAARMTPTNPEQSSSRDRMLAAGEMIAEIGRGPRETSTPPSLTHRELDVLSQVALGCSNAEVAARLSLSPETIKSYLRNIGVKLGTSTRAGSVAQARMLGLLL